MASDDAERAQKVVRAYDLHVQRWDLRRIGDELGVSHETARRWIKEYRDAIEWHEARERSLRSDRVAALLGRIIDRGIRDLEAVDEDGQPVNRYGDVAPHVVRALAELNRVEGNYAPTRVAVSDDRRRAPDPELRDALEREARAAEVVDAEDQRRELE